MNILTISNYPTEEYPGDSTFVYNLMQGLSEFGNSIEVINPIQVFKRRTYIREKGKYKYGKELCRIITPRFFNLPTYITNKKFIVGNLNRKFHYLSVKSSLEFIENEPDLIYAHFAFLSGSSGLLLKKRFNVPLILALGESTLQKYFTVYGKEQLTNVIKQSDGIVSVSQVNIDFCIKELGLSHLNYIVSHNAVDREKFKPKDKLSIRKQLDLPVDKKIILFVGHFDSRKNIDKVIDALNRVEDVYGIFLGSGKELPKNPKILYSGKVPYDRINKYYQAADVFVLPTKNEGSCNAIAEAMACGLPIVSSNIPAVKEQVDMNSSILVNPDCSEELENAIKQMFENIELYTESALKQKKVIGINERADIIYNFIKNTINEC